MNIDPAWLNRIAAENGVLSGWTRDGERWVRRWVRVPAWAEEAKAGDVAYVVYLDEGGWSFDSIMDADGPADTAQDAMGWCDRKGCSAVLLAMGVES